MKKVLLILALIVAYGSMAFAIENSSASASGTLQLYKDKGLTITVDQNPVLDLGTVIPGTNHTFSLPEMRFYVTGAGGYDPAGNPAPVGANIDWAFPGAATSFIDAQNDKWEMWPTDLYLLGNMRYGSDGAPGGPYNDRETLAPDGIAAVYFKPVSIQAAPTFSGIGAMTIPVNVTVSYDPGQ